MSTDQVVTTDGQPAEEYYEDYWGVQETFRYMLPDGKQYFEIVPLDEGGKTKFQRMTNKGIRMNQRTQDAHLDVDPSDERHTLIELSVTGWNLMQKGPDGKFSNLPCPADERQRNRIIRDTILSKFNPKVIQDLEFFIRTKNPWMQADMDMEALIEERDRIELLIKQKKEQEAGEAHSATK